MAAKPVICKFCGATNKHYSTWCRQKPPSKSGLKIRKPIKKQSDKELEYQAWKEEYARPFVINRDGNICQCCGRAAYEGEKLDLDHIEAQRGIKSLKWNVKNLHLLCRWPCHRNKTDNKPCLHY